MVQPGPVRNPGETTGSSYLVMHEIKDIKEESVRGVVKVQMLRGVSETLGVIITRQGWEDDLV